MLFTLREMDTKCIYDKLFTSEWEYRKMYSLRMNPTVAERMVCVCMCAPGAASRKASAEVSPSAYNDVLQIYISKWRAPARSRGSSLV